MKIAYDSKGVLYWLLDDTVSPEQARRWADDYNWLVAAGMADDWVRCQDGFYRPLATVADAMYPLACEEDT